MNQTSLILTIPGPPRTKKTSNRILRFGRFNKIIPSRAFLAYQNAALWHLKQTLGHRDPIRTPCNVAAVFYRDANHGDATGFYQALADILEAAHVIENDRLIQTWDGSRLELDRANPRVELTITTG